MAKIFFVNITYRKSSEVMPEIVVWLEFWFHMRASVVKWPSAASRICSGVHSIPSFSKFVSNQLSSYHPKKLNFDNKGETKTEFETNYHIRIDSILDYFGNK